MSTAVGYTGGHKDNPTYEEVCAGNTGHAEAIEVLYDPHKLLMQNYSMFSGGISILQHSTDNLPTSGTQYRTAIFYHSEEQRQSAESSKEEMERSGIYNDPIVTEITPASTFYKAEGYHQKYYEKCPVKI